MARSPFETETCFGFVFFSNLRNRPLHFRTADYRSNFRKNTDKYGHLATLRCTPALLLSLLFPPLFLLTLTTGRRVLVCSCCFFDTFTPAPRHAAEEFTLGLEVKQV